MTLQARTGALLIQTPEGIVFPLTLAGPVSRFLALLIDIFIVLALTGMMGLSLLALQRLIPDISGAIYYLGYFVFSIGYPIFTEWRWRGQTLGKRVLRLRVMDAQGLRLQLSQIVIRNLLRFIDSLPLLYVVGGLSCLFSRRAQRLGDIAANTIVVRNPQPAQPDLGQLMAGKYNSFRDYPHLAARLRQRISPRDAMIGLEALLRRNDLDPAARVELFSEIAEHMKQFADFPQEALEGLTDEQYVRNVVDIVFSQR